MLASEMITKDGLRAVLLYMLLITPRVLADYYTPAPWLGSNVGMVLIDRIVEMSVFILIALRWLTPSSATLTTRIKCSLIYILITFSLSLLFSLPLAVAAQAPLPLAMLCLTLIGGLLFIWNRYYFYFAPVLAGQFGPQKILSSARKLTDLDWKIPIRSLLPGLGLMMVATSFAGLLSPDGRNLWLSLLGQALSGILGFAVAYLSVATFLIYAPINLLAELNINVPNKPKKPGIFADLLNPRRGLILIFAAFFLKLAAEINGATLTPSASIEIIAAKATAQGAEIDLRITDPNSQFRGFLPMAFSLAGEKGSTVAVSPSLGGEQMPNLQSFAWSPKLAFKPIDPKTELAKLQDLYLWYRRYKVAKVNFSSENGE